jgi:hypothetical protein
MGPVFLAAYDGAYGPTVRVDVLDHNGLARIINVFRGLASTAEASTESLDLVREPWVTTETLGALVLRCESRQRMPQRTLRKQPGSTGLPCYTWTLDRDGWEHAASLLQGLLDHGGPAHQYLTHEGIDDAIVEVAYRE